MQGVTGLEWWLAICATTIGVRACLTPLTIWHMKNTVTMANLKPATDAINVRIQTSGLSIETAKAEQTAQLNALFKKHDTHPFYAFVMPIVQVMSEVDYHYLQIRNCPWKVRDCKSDSKPWRCFYYQAPLLISLFFGLKNLGDYFPAAATGGAYWFTDLTIPDESMALPVKSYKKNHII